MNVEQDAIEQHLPARRYVFIDDKPRLLDAFKASWGERVVTVFPRQGHYARDADALARMRTPDLAVDRIGDLRDLDSPPWLARADAAKETAS